MPTESIHVAGIEGASTLIAIQIIFVFFYLFIFILLMFVALSHISRDLIYRDVGVSDSLRLVAFSLDILNISSNDLWPGSC